VQEVSITQATRKESQVKIYPQFAEEEKTDDPAIPAMPEMQEEFTEE